jgi:CubicO group peptidase (beta-lactamase class C family)
LLSLLHAVAASAILTIGDGLPSKAPNAVGMSASRLATVDRVVARGVAAGGYPGAAVVVGRKGAAVWEKGFGRIGWSPDAPLVSPGRTIYDLASLTKVVATASAIMLLYDEGRVDLDAPASRYLPTFVGEGRERVTVRQLLTHHSGLPAGRNIWRIAHDPVSARMEVLRSALKAQPGTRYEYSDLGADLLGFIAEEITGEPLDSYLDRRIWKPLGMTDTYFRPPASLRERIAPTEVTPPRGYPLRGEVHDENAFALGGVAGHAGLFSTATDLSVYAQMMLNRGTYNGVRIFADSTVALFTARSQGTRALGWDSCTSGGSCGQHFSSRSYGHTGFTGTSLWIDPERDMFVILLTNRVHAAKALRPVRVIADVRADLADAAALAVIDYGPGLLAMPTAFRADKAVGWNQPLPKKAPAKKTVAKRTTAKKPVAKAPAKKPAARKTG